MNLERYLINCTFEEAEKEYRAAIKINPGYAEAHANFGILLKELNRAEEAKSELKTAERLFIKQGDYRMAAGVRELLNGL